MLVEAVPNFSAGRDPRLIEALARAASGRCLRLDVDSDAIHNRSVVTVAAAELEPLLDALVNAVEVASRRIDLRRHTGVHPRVGAADVIPLVPLADTSMAACVEAAHRLGQRIWAELKVPVYFYGEAALRPAARRLSRIRAGEDPPDLGGALHPTAGAVSVGARPPLLAYNIVLPGASIPAARRLAAAIRESSGGVPGVQALAFDLGDGLLQLSMNLVRLDAVTPGQVLARARELARDLLVELGPEEVVGLCPAAAADTPAAAGRLLEARLAAAAARSGAERCRASGNAELALLAGRLDARADQLAELGTDGDSLLRGAEEAAALPRVLARAGVLDPGLATAFDAAARGLRGAVAPALAVAESARVAALDRWLAEPRTSG